MVIIVSGPQREHGSGARRDGATRYDTHTEEFRYGSDANTLVKTSKMMAGQTPTTKETAAPPPLTMATGLSTVVRISVQKMRPGYYQTVCPFSPFSSPSC